jgi:hypothetical protein
MPLVKKYAPTAPPKFCRYAESNPTGQKCRAELVVEKPGGPVYVCKRHAAKELSDNASLLANAIRELLLDH